MKAGNFLLFPELLAFASNSYFAYRKAIAAELVATLSQMLFLDGIKNNLQTYLSSEGSAPPVKTQAASELSLRSINASVCDEATLFQAV